MKKLVMVLLTTIVFNMCTNTLVFAVSKNGGKNVEKKEDTKSTSKAENKSISHWKKKKEKIIKDIYAQTNISSLMDLSKAAQQLSDISAKLEDVNYMYKNLKTQKRSIDKKYNEVLDEAKQLMKELQAKKKQLSNILLKIKYLKKDFSNLKKQLKEIRQSIFISKKNVEYYILILYKINNDYYGDLSQLDNIKLLFKGDENIAEILSQEEIIDILSIKSKELIAKLEEQERKKKKFMTTLYKKKAEYVNLVNKYNTQLKILRTKKKMLVDLFTMLKENKKQVDQYYDRIHKKRINLAKQKIRIVKGIKGQMHSAADDSIIKAKPIDLSSIISYTIKTDGDKFLSWPTRSLSISAYYHDERYFKLFGWEHDGMDIRTTQGSEIYAPAAGYVYKVVDNNSDYYNYIILVHNYGYITLYGHISKSLVKEGDIVKRGQIIALSGGKKGTRGAGKLSTGPHLHFEVYKNGQHIDPLSVMDLSVYPAKKYLPKKWYIKYMKDNITRKIDVSNIKFNNLISHKQRQQNFLKRAAKGFGDLKLWERFAGIYGIDTDFGICVAFAESGIGHHLSSKNNLGNVGNNDRGDRVDVATPAQGIASIYYTFNNKYLKKYYTIYKLSRYGNKDSHIYSSSTYNWYKNVVKCMSKLKGHPIDEYYPFRKLKNMDRIHLKKYYDNMGI